MIGCSHGLFHPALTRISHKLPTAVYSFAPIVNHPPHKALLPQAASTYRKYALGVFLSAKPYGTGT